MPFTVTPTPLPGLLLIEPRVFPDERGFFMETYRDSDLAAAGIHGPFLQDNHSCSSRSTLRGLHFQRPPHAQGKLVRVTAGRVWDVAVDLRPGSPTFGRWQSVELSADNHRIFWIPAGFAHGFLALEDGSELLYKCTEEYNAASEGGIRWDDPDLAISWPLERLLVSPKDAQLPFLRGLGEIPRWPC